MLEILFWVTGVVWILSALMLLVLQEVGFRLDRKLWGDL